VDGVVKKGTKKVENSKSQESPTEKENNAQVNPEPPQNSEEETSSP
jgi:hypothetical protein